ncbi:FAD-dependent oxidoreductase, partial [Curtobacterium sp. CT11-45]
MHVVIVGSGIAGLTAAIRASARHDVTLVTKGALADGATAYAQGGVAV